MEKILLIQAADLFAGSLHVTKNEVYKFDMSFLRIGSILRHHRIEFVSVTRPPRPKDYSDISRYMKEFGQNIDRLDYSIACISSNFDFAYTETLLLGQIFASRGKTTIIGGYNVWNFASTYRQWFDYIVCGDGEEVLPGLISQIHRGIKVRKHTAGEIVTASPCKLNLRSPDLDWSIVREHDDFDRALKEHDSFQFGMYASIGCSYRCSFCSNRTYLEHGYAHRSYPVDYVFRQLANLEREFPELGAKTEIYFHDALFPPSSKWRAEFFGRLGTFMKRSEFQMTWEDRIDLISNTQLRKIKAMNGGTGRILLEFGLESGSPSILQKLTKTRNPSAYLRRMKEIAEFCEHGHIGWLPFVIFGIPSETPAETRDNFRYLQDLYRGSRYGRPQMSKYRHYRGSQFTDVGCMYPDWFQKVPTTPYRSFYSIISSFTHFPPGYTMVDLGTIWDEMAPAIYQNMGEDDWDVRAKIRNRGINYWKHFTSTRSYAEGIQSAKKIFEASIELPFEEEKSHSPEPRLPDFVFS